MALKKFISGDIEHRRRQTAAVSRMMLQCFTAIYHHWPDRSKRNHLGTILEEALVAFAIKACEDDGSPCRGSDISGMLGIPRSNIQRSLERLLQNEMIRKDGRIYLCNPEFLKKIDPDDWTRIHRAVLDAATALRRG